MRSPSFGWQIVPATLRSANVNASPIEIVATGQRGVEDAERGEAFLLHRRHLLGIARAPRLLPVAPVHFGLHPEAPLIDQRALAHIVRPQRIRRTASARYRLIAIDSHTMQPS